MGENLLRAYKGMRNRKKWSISLQIRYLLPMESVRISIWNYA